MKNKRILLTLLLVAACSQPFDDSAIQETLRQHESRLNQLEDLCRTMNGNLSSIQRLVDAVDSRDYIIGFSVLRQNGVEIGYELRFASGSSISLYHGKDGRAPVIGIRQYTDGKWYWTLDGSWITDGTGRMMPVSGTDGVNGINGTTPQLKIVDGYWYISYDNGKSWSRAGQATGDPGTNGTNGTNGATPQLKIEDGYWYVSFDEGKTWSNAGQATGDPGTNGDSFFNSVTETEDSVVLVLSDGTTIEIPKRKKLDIVFDLDGGNGILAGETKTIAYSVLNGTEATVVKAFGQNGWSAKVHPSTHGKGVIDVQAPEVIQADDAEIIILAYDGEETTIMKTLSFGTFQFRSGATWMSLYNPPPRGFLAALPRPQRLLWIIR